MAPSSARLSKFQCIWDRKWGSYRLWWSTKRYGGCCESFIFRSYCS
ncbi:hypothetical protein Godav_024542 [Gossypium davidsonii]|uniref:Uncharacterized protein n=2 Tax=Gossypium TaxID=3633 RepID=A0A7J8T7F9_GOSDV|nr:hypothetical protein [Gossypium davidsonii]MBA0669515.1 hypothetical protein [Gossypium klotzschianum]